MSSVPAYDVSLDELSVALSYATMSLGESAVPVAPKKPVPAPAAPPAPKTARQEDNKKVEKKKEPKKKDDDDDDFAVFDDEEGDEGETEKKAPKEEDDNFDVFGDDEEGGSGEKESRKDMLARLKKEAEERTAKKEAKQRTLVGIEIKPWAMEQDLLVLWKKITQTVTQEGLKWGEGCTLVDVAFGIKKIQTTFTMGVNNSSDDVVEAIQAMEDEVQSVEVTSMNVL